ncbi:MAG: hypothetical protein M5U26_08330 [Planctomycetota bacterium]|nr:hypothetical protein [Planctomycetota bacterium]
MTNPLPPEEWPTGPRPRRFGANPPNVPLKYPEDFAVFWSTELAELLGDEPAAELVLVLEEKTRQWYRFCKQEWLAENFNRKAGGR